jgi:hypothetical protein
MDLRDVAIASITWARSPDEEIHLRRSIAHLATLGLPIAVADAGSSDSFARHLRRFPALMTTTALRPGLVPQICASLALAASTGRAFILYVEADKEHFFRNGLLDFVRCADGEPDVGVVIAARSEETFQTFPPMQRYTEGVINRLVSDETGCPGDYSYGPFLLNRTLLPVLADLPDHVGWGWRPFTFAAAHRRGYRVVHVTGDRACPPEQRVEDEAERRHRLEQLRQNIHGLLV